MTTDMFFLQPKIDLGEYKIKNRHLAVFKLWAVLDSNETGSDNYSYHKPKLNP